MYKTFIDRSRHLGNVIVSGGKAEMTATRWHLYDGSDNICYQNLLLLFLWFMCICGKPITSKVFFSGKAYFSITNTFPKCVERFYVGSTPLRSVKNKLHRFFRIRRQRNGHKFYHLEGRLEINFTQRFLTTKNARNIPHSVNASDFLLGLWMFTSLNIPTYRSDPSYSDSGIEILIIKLTVLWNWLGYALEQWLLSGDSCGHFLKTEICSLLMYPKMCNFLL